MQNQLIERLESRRLLTAFVVDSLLDGPVGGPADGNLTLREAVVAANGNRPVGDAPAGQAAGDTITFAASLAGGTLDLTAGQLGVTDDLVLNADGPYVTIDAGGRSRIFSVLNDESVTLANLILTNADAPGTGGAVSLAGRGARLLDGLVVSDSRANQDGGGLSVSDGDVTVRNSLFARNQSGVAGGGIYVSGGNVAVDSIALTDNEATGVNGDGCGGGIYVATGANAVVSFANSTVTGNVSEIRGGGYWNGGTNASTVTNSLIADNTARGPMADMGGGGLYNSGTLRVVDCAVDGNFASGAAGSGGGLIQLGGTVEIVNSRFDGNQSVRAGGGFEVTRGTSLSITNSLLSNNSTQANPGNGGALHVTPSGFTTNVTDSLVTGNDAAAEGGGLWNAAGSTMNVVNTGVTDNIATGDMPDMGGGGIYNNGGTLNVTNTLVDANLATGISGSGGGLLSVDGAVTVTDSLISNNTSNRAGGGVEIIDGSISFANSGLTGNGTGVSTSPDARDGDPADGALIALGDSITFGETDLRYIPDFGTTTGYPTRVADFLASLNDGERPELFNFAIDGETADSFQDNTGRTPPVVGRTDVPLQLQNLNYDADNLIPQQQLFLNTVADQRAAGNEIGLITFTLGFNEVAALSALSNGQAMIPQTLATYRQNFTDVLTTIRDAAPEAEIALLNYYNPFPADDNVNPARPIFAEAGPQLNAIIKQLAGRFGAAYVDNATPFLGNEAAFTFIDEVGAGDMVPEPTPFGDGTAPIGNVHPNATGYDVIADQVTGALQAGGGSGPVANPGNGGAVHVSGMDGTTVSVTGGTLVDGNAAAAEGGGLWNQSGSTTSVDTSVVTNNTAGTDGGGFYNNGGTALFGSTLITDNMAGNSGGGVFTADGGTTTLVDSAVTGNDPDDLAGPGTVA